MIKNKVDLKRYLEQDKIALYRKNDKKPKLFGDVIWKFEILLRKTEYYNNCADNIFKKVIKQVYRYRYHKCSIRYGFYIPLNVFEEGLSIAHYGNIVVNPMAHIGKNCRIHEMVNIGATNGSNKAANIGNNVFIGSGVKIIGKLTIADDIAIGANAVVVKSIEESGSTWGGVPAKKISNNSSKLNLCPDLFKAGKIND